MPAIMYPFQMAGGVPVVTAPAGIDTTTAGFASLAQALDHAPAAGRPRPELESAATPDGRPAQPAPARAPSRRRAQMAALTGRCWSSEVKGDD